MVSLPASSAKDCPERCVASNARLLPPAGLLAPPIVPGTTSEVLVRQQPWVVTSRAWHNKQQRPWQPSLFF